MEVDRDLACVRTFCKNGPEPSTTSETTRDKTAICSTQEKRWQGFFFTNLMKNKLQNNVHLTLN